MPIFLPPTMLANSLSLQNAVSPLTLNLDRTTWGNFTTRQLISASNIIKTGSGVAVTIEAPAGQALSVLAAYIGERSGATTSFAATPVQLLWGGSGTPTISAGASLESDVVPFAISGSADLIVSLYANQAYRRERSGALSGYALYYKSGNDASTVSTSGYADYSSNSAIGSFKGIRVMAP